MKPPSSGGYQVHVWVSQVLHKATGCPLILEACALSAAGCRGGSPANLGEEEPGENVPEGQPRLLLALNQTCDSNEDTESGVTVRFVSEPALLVIFAIPRADPVAVAVRTWAHQGCATSRDLTDLFHNHKRCGLALLLLDCCCSPDWVANSKFPAQNYL